MKSLLFILALAGSAFAQNLKTPGVNGENIVNPAFRNAVLPAQSTHSGKYLQTDGTNATWQTVTAGTTYTAGTGITLPGNAITFSPADGSISNAKLTTNPLARANHTGTQAIGTVTDLQTELNGKQSSLVSGTNLKSINGSTLLGSGDVDTRAVRFFDDFQRYPSALLLSATTTNGSTSISFAANTDITSGMYISHPNIPDNTTVVSNTTTSAVLSAAATASGTSLTIDSGVRLIGGSSIPLVGNPWRVSYNTTGSGNTPITTGVTGGFGSISSRLWYIGSYVDTPNKKFSFGCTLAALPSNFPAGINSWSLNMSFAGTQMLNPTGTGINPSGVMHVNMSWVSVAQIDYYQHTFSSVAATDIISLTEHDMATGDKLLFGGTLPTGMTGGHYYAIVIDANNFRVASTYENAMAGTYLDIGAIALGGGGSVKIDDIVCVNRPSVVGGHLFKEGVPSAPLGAEAGFLFEVDGEFLTITKSNVGSVIYRSPSLVRKMKAVTHFWYESSGDHTGTINSYPSILKAWANSPSLDNAYIVKSHSLVDFALGYSNNSYPVGLPGSLRMTNPSGKLLLTGNNPSGGSRLSVGGSSTKSFNGANVAVGGNTYIEGGYLGNVGNVDLGGNVVGRAVMAVDSGVIAATTSATIGSDVVLKGFSRANTLEPGDRQISTIVGNLTAGTKTLKVRIWATGESIFNSGAITHTGPFKIVIRKKALTSFIETTYVEFYVNNSMISLTRVQNNNTNWYGYEFVANQDTASQVVLEDVAVSVEKVKVLND